MLTALRTFKTNALPTTPIMGIDLEKLPTYTVLEFLAPEEYLSKGEPSNVQRTWSFFKTKDNNWERIDKFPPDGDDDCPQTTTSQELARFFYDMDVKMPKNVVVLTKELIDVIRKTS